jgi:hypothetical protein
MKENWVSWVEIPVSDFKRAKQFYERVFLTDIEEMDLGNLLMGVFPHGNIGCALCENEFYKPGNHGPLVYLNANSNLDESIDRILQNGGKVLVEKRLISPEHGYMAVFEDTEGNRLALHSAQ